MRKVLIVDDSSVVRGLIKSALTGLEDFCVGATAANGVQALEVLRNLPCDIAVVDLEMPEMNGLTLLERLADEYAIMKVIIFASPTKTSAMSALQGLNRGAFDFVLKPVGNGDPVGAIRDALLPKLKAAYAAPSIGQSLPAARLPCAPRVTHSNRGPGAVVIGSSTGGPNALEKIFTGFGVTPSVPIFIVQHMPAVFTAVLAERLSNVSGLEVREGRNFEEVKPGRVYLAPGDFHMTVELVSGRPTIRLNRDPQRHSVRPAVDYLFESASEVYGRDLLGYILTGMGEDGRDGAVRIKAAGGKMIIQSAETCVVYGMPRAVFEAQAFDEQIDLERIRESLIRSTTQEMKERIAK